MMVIRFRYDLPMPGRHWSLELYSRDPIHHDKTAIFLLLCMLILTLGATLVFYRGIAHFIKLPDYHHASAPQDYT